MTRHLFDVNVLVALAWPNHVHHGAAQRWFANHQPAWATTPITECGFVRVSSNPRVVATAVGPSDAMTMLATMTAWGDHEFLPDPISHVIGTEAITLTGHQQVTDAHLVALARHHGAVLATFDRAVRALGADDVVLIPA